MSVESKERKENVVNECQALLVLVLRNFINYTIYFKMSKIMIFNVFRRFLCLTLVVASQIGGGF